MRKILKPQTVAHMEEVRKARREGEKDYDRKASDVIDESLEKVFSHAYRDFGGGHGKTNRGMHSLPAPYLPSIINGVRVYS
jgi:hypothetical protein